MKYLIKSGLVVGVIVTATALVPAATRTIRNHVHSHRSERHPELVRGLRDLQKSREDLMRANRDFGGHRTKAVQAIDAAIDEIKQAIAFDRH